MHDCFLSEPRNCTVTICVILTEHFSASIETTEEKRDQGLMASVLRNFSECESVRFLKELDLVVREYVTRF